MCKTRSDWFSNQQGKQSSFAIELTVVSALDLGVHLGLPGPIIADASKIFHAKSLFYVEVVQCPDKHLQ